MLFAPKEKGQGVVGYAILILFIVIVVFGMRLYVSEMFEGICNWLLGGG